jgi:putative transposase
MGKNGTKRAGMEEIGTREGPESARREDRLGRIFDRTRRALRELVIGYGLEVFQELLEEDRNTLCGARYAPDEGREAYRHGYDTGQLVMGGRRVTLPKPRVRSTKGKEMSLPTWERMRSEDPLRRRVAEQILIGVSTRKYAKSLEPLPDGLESEGVSRSSVSRHFVARTQKEVEKFFGRSLEGIDLPIIMVDGIQIDDHVVSSRALGR